MSVTYGAGGGTSKNTVRIASEIEKNLHTTALAHLTCVSSTKDEVNGILSRLKENGIENVLALRGDRPSDPPDISKTEEYRYAYQLVRDIRAAGDFCIGAACYPEGHVESANLEEDLTHLREKVDSGVDFLVTQMFFENRSMYSFMDRAAQKGITVPVIVGIMPVISSKTIRRMVDLSGTSLTPRLNSILDKWGDDPDAMMQAGIIHASEQIVDLVSNGIRGIHIYTMNKPEVAQAICKNISFIIH
jgi:methylenetetrahydrofolate reductase (NADPH)